jgi:hypothetical protein
LREQRKARAEELTYKKHKEILQAKILSRHFMFSAQEQGSHRLSPAAL